MTVLSFNSWLTGRTALAIALASGALLRVWRINDVGYNSDEAVYAGQAAALAGDQALTPFFPVFRAHPLLLQTGLAAVYQITGVSDLYGRLVAIAIGIATVYIVYLLGSELYGRRVGTLAAVWLALMPYHVIVTRQLLLDVPVAFFSTLTLYMLARFACSQHRAWLYAAGATLGLTALSKTNGIVLVGAAYAFLALSPRVRIRPPDLALATACMLVVVGPYPLTVALAGRSETGRQYLAWQLFRPPNHDWTFYLSTLPAVIGPLVILAAFGGVWLTWHRRSWRETLLCTWTVVPVAFFQLWPTKGFQYLLPISAPVAVLAAAGLERGLATLPRVRVWRWRPASPLLTLCAAACTALTLLAPTLQAIWPAQTRTLVAGSGGVPGGRETGLWVGEHVPEGAQMLAIGPSIANIIQFYGHRKVYGLSVSPNPLHRNPAYEPVSNPDRLIRDNQLHYVVWDSFSATRTPFFSNGVLRYVAKYHGEVVHTENLASNTNEASDEQPLIIIYQVRP